MSKPFRYDWEGLKERMIAAGDEPAAFCLYCLPKAGAQLLLAAMERLRWESTYRINDYDFADWQDLQNIVDETERGIMSCEDLLADIVGQVTTNITTIVNEQTVINSANSGICCYGDTQPTIEPPPTTEIPTTPTERNELCKQAQQAHDNGLLFLQHIFTVGTAGGGLSAGLIGFILALYTMTLPVALLVTFIGALLLIINDLVTDEAENDWVAIKPDIVCALYSSITGEQAKAAIDEVIDSSAIFFPIKTLFKTIYNQAQVNKIFNLEIAMTGAYTGSYCMQCEEPGLYEVLFDFDDAAEFDFLTFGGATWEETEEAMRFRISQATPTSGNVNINIDKAVSYLGLPVLTKMRVINWEVRLFTDANPYGCISNTVHVKVLNAAGAVEIVGSYIQNESNQEIIGAGNAPTDIPLRATNFLLFNVAWTKPGTCDGQGTYVWLDYIKLLVATEAP